VQQAMVFGPRRNAIEALEQVEDRPPRERYHAYPFDLSAACASASSSHSRSPAIPVADRRRADDWLDVTTQKAVWT